MASYVHVHRHPDEVYLSTLKMQSNFSNSVQLQTPKNGVMEKMVLDYYKEVHSSYFRYRSIIAKNKLIEISYQELNSKPIQTLKKVYSILGLQNFDGAVPHFEVFLAARSGHKHNGYPPLAPIVRETLRREWKTAYEEWGYK